MGDDTELAGPALTYAQRVGQRLRAIRRQQRLSLQEVEAQSGQMFKASVLGAYERGERVISVPRLQRLAGFYHVPVDQLLPREDQGEGAIAAAAGSASETSDIRRATASPPKKVTFDLSRFAGLGNDTEVVMMQRYLDTIQMLRQDFNGRVLTVRNDDIRAMAGLFGTDPDTLVRRLEALELRLQPA